MIDVGIAGGYVPKRAQPGWSARLPEAATLSTCVLQHVIEALVPVHNASCTCGGSSGAQKKGQTWGLPFSKLWLV
jgi:hypothetical protein